MIRREESLIPLEQAARQKVAELHSARESEKSQGSVLKAILQAKETNKIEGIYGRLGDLGAIDGELSDPISNCFYHLLLPKNKSPCFLPTFCVLLGNTGMLDMFTSLQQSMTLPYQQRAVDSIMLL